MIVKKVLPAILFLSVLVNLAKTQNVGISNTSITPDPSAGLEIRYSNKGLLMPRISLVSETDATTVSAPAEGLIVYNTNSLMSGGLARVFILMPVHLHHPSGKNCLAKTIHGFQEVTTEQILIWIFWGQQIIKTCQ